MSKKLRAILQKIGDAVAEAIAYLDSEGQRTLGFDDPPDDVPAPTKELCGTWNAGRIKVGLGRERAMGAHAKAFRQLFFTCKEDLAWSQRTIEAFFASDNEHYRRAGWSLRMFMATQDGIVYATRPTVELRAVEYVKPEPVPVSDEIQDFISRLGPKPKV